MIDQETTMFSIKETITEKNTRHRIADTELLSAESCFVAFSFFTVLSQIILYAVSDTISKPFRPLIVLILTIMAIRRGRLRVRACATAFAMSVYQFLIFFFFYPDGGGIESYLQFILYFMMLCAVASFPWNRRELQLIIRAVFLGTIVCAVVFFLSNNMFNYNNAEFMFFGERVNRNKNAYAFALGIVLGWQHLSFGKGKNKTLIIIFMLLEGYCLIYSQCRGAFLGAFLAFSVAALSKAYTMYKKGNPNLIPFLLTFIFSCILLYLLIKGSPFSRLIDGENLSGRDEGIEYAMELFRKAPLLGKIFGNGVLYEGKHTEGIGVHLVYLTYLLEGGIIAAGMIVLIFIQSMRRMRGRLQWPLFVLALSKTFFEGMDYYVFIPLILALCISNYEHMYKRSGKELF